MSTMKQITIQEKDHARLNKIRGKKISSENINFSFGDTIGFLLDFFEKEQDRADTRNLNVKKTEIDGKKSG